MNKSKRLAKIKSPLLQKKGRYKKILSFSFAIALLLFITLITSFASYDDATVTKLLDRHDFPQNSFLAYMGRSIMWALIKGLRWFISGIEGLSGSLITSIGKFFSSETLTTFTNDKVVPIIFAVFTLVLLFVFVMFAVNSKNSKQVLKNILIGLVLFISIPTLVSSMYDVTNASIDAIGNDKLDSMADSIIFDNVIDIKLYDTNDFGELTYNSYFANNEDPAGIDKVDIVELIDPTDTRYPELWKSELKHNDDGTAKLVEFDNGSIKKNIDVLTDGYYRWQVDWFSLIVTLLLTGFVLLLSTFKIAILLFDISASQILAQALALLDVYSHERLKKVLIGLVGGFVTLFSTFAMLQFYIIGTNYINKEIEDVFTGLFALAGLSVLLVKGLNKIEELFGLGTSSRGGIGSMLFGAQSAMGLASGAKQGVKNTIGKLGRTADRAGGAIGSVGGRVAGMVQGRKDANEATAPEKGADKQEAQGAESTAIQSPQERADDTVPPKSDGSDIGKEATATQSDPDKVSPATAQNSESSPADKKGKGDTSTPAKGEKQKEEWQEQKGLAPELRDDKGKADKSASGTTKEELPLKQPADDTSAKFNRPTVGEKLMKNLQSTRTYQRTTSAYYKGYNQQAGKGVDKNEAPTDRK